MRRLVAAFDGPTRARDLAALFSARMLALWMVFLHGAIGGALGGMLYYSASETDAMAHAGSVLGLGQYLAVALLLAFGALFTIVIPLRAMGTIEMPRFGRYFDQLVLSGVAPLRLFAGRIVAQNAFGLLLVAGAMPYAIFALSLGGTRAPYVITGFVVLFVYANVLSLLTLSVSVFVHEAVAALLVVVGAGFVYVLGSLPIPLPLLGTLTPSSLLARPYWEATGGQAILDAYVGAKGGAGAGLLSMLHGLDPLVAYLAGVPVIAGFCLAALVLGPTRCLIEETGAFGEVVIAGDARRAAFMRKRFILRRRSEISFLYENTPLWVRRWEAPLRYGAWCAMFLVITGYASATAIGLAQEFRPHQWYALSMFGLIVLLGMASMVFTSDRATLGTSFNCGRRHATAASLDPAAFAGVAALVLFAARYLGPILDDAGLMWVGPRNDPQGYAARLLDVAMPMTVLCMFQVYAAAQFLACKAWNRAIALLSAAGLLFVVWFGPWVGALLMLEGTRYEGPRMPTVGIVASLSPVAPYTLVFDSGSRLAKLLRTHGDQSLAFGLQAALFTTFAVAAMVRRRRVAGGGSQ